MPEPRVAPPEAAVGPSRARRALDDARLFERYRRTGDKDAREALVSTAADTVARIPAGPPSRSRRHPQLQPRRGGRGAPLLAA